ncbi:MAG TPA: phosphate ABC transporter permease subunit PstC [Acidimicrobiales bacterium]|nr:phosphate ABC transporter permease subunit PstC [Acidimicrobiales bacterium]
MTTNTASADPTRPGAVTSPGRAGLSDRVFRGLSLGCGLLVLVILALIAWSTVREAWPAFPHEGLRFFTSTRWAPSAEVFGSLPFVYGTVVTAVVALVLAAPVSVGIALFLSDVAPRRLSRAVGSLVDLLAAVPSVVYGLWGVIVLAPWISRIYDTVSDVTSPVPVLSNLLAGPSTGRSLFTGGIILALMVIPIVTSVTTEVFDTVPTMAKEAAYALGATRWEMIRAAVFPHSRAGIVAAVLLGLGRAMGETIAAALVIGSSPQISARLFGSGDSMAAVIANEFGEAGGIHRAALIALGAELFALSIVVNVAARMIVRRRAGER